MILELRLERTLSFTPDWRSVIKTSGRVVVSVGSDLSKEVPPAVSALEPGYRRILAEYRAHVDAQTLEFAFQDEEQPSEPPLVVGV